MGFTLRENHNGHAHMRDAGIRQGVQVPVDSITSSGTKAIPNRK